MPSIDRRARIKGRRGSLYPGPFALIPVEVLESAAYHAQPDWARTVLVAIAGRYSGVNNGSISLPFSVAKRLGISAQWKLYAGVQLLGIADLIMCTSRGRLEYGTKLPNLYALTWRRIDHSHTGIFDYAIPASPLPTNAWARWTRPDSWKATVRDVTRRSRGTSKLDTKTPHTHVQGDGRTKHVGEGALQIATQRWGEERRSTAPSTLVTSKISGGGERRDKKAV